MAAAGAKSRTRAPRPGRYQDVRAVDDDGLASGHVPQEEHPHGPEQQGACEQDEAGVAEGKFETDTQTRRSIHGFLPLAWCLVMCQCGSRRRRRWQ